jgi:hypothetical protein
LISARGAGRAAAAAAVGVGRFVAPLAVEAAAADDDGDDLVV